ncbi:hypothetical protein [Sphingobacterium athyrii]|uniref:Zf-HC2 domain-containing protein n=1 Tax=Sphingobacterium athyrii TaxID=2152717 RepID=A0A363NLW5_9SPHI|nr:hypothetical protein [Sphingobacterium athyrii]PUV21753.1 hypothetical protein DCO56_25820 [Sphingobacterium athyrii]
MVRRLIHILFMPCRQATLLIEKRNAGSITSFQKIRLSAHLMICKWCNAYNRKINVMEDLMKKIFTQDAPEKFNKTDLQLFKDKLKEKLK